MMSNEEFDRKAEFLLNQQARFDAGMQELKEGQKELQEAQKVTDEKFKHMYDGFEEIKELTIQTREDLAELTTLTTDGFRILYEQSRNTDAKIAALVNAQIETEEMIRNTNATICTIGVKFDRHLKEDHNSG
jgi:predicted transcriptional regulator